MRRRGVVLLALGTAAYACPRARDAESETLLRLSALHERVEESARSRPGPPADLREACAGNTAGLCGEVARGRQPADAWATAVAYARQGSAYELRSAGPDRRMRTADDLVIASSRVDAQRRELAGCYAGRRGGAPAPAAEVRLDTTRVGVAGYRFSMPSGYFGKWFPLGDFVLLEFNLIESYEPVLMRVEGDSLVPRDPRAAGGRIPTLNRAPCGAETQAEARR
ncbi:MAG TPA: hypothetical protein VFQ45_12850 [Longimicrobium sp.]|nr:hypothetical protein [Longimicrobium sp.]